MSDADSKQHDLDEVLLSTFGFDDADRWLSLARRAAEPPPPGQLGPYKVLATVATGAQGTVYQAVQPGTHRLIAIKRLCVGQFASPEARRRFEREMKLVSALAHPGVVTVLGTDEIGGQPVLLMEWIDGVPIHRWSRNQPIRARLEVFARVCDAVAHAHRRGVLHRDLKPNNILVESAADGSSVPTTSPKVLDFGLARALDEDQSVASRAGFLGTPAYAAPEQVEGRHSDVDTRTDVYALGVVLYEMLTSELPHRHGDDLAALFDAIRHVEPPRPSTRSSGLDPELDAIVLTAMAKEPPRRYQNVDSLAADVRRYLDGNVVLAHPPRLIYRVRKFVGRNRVPVFAAAVMAVLIVAAAGVVAGMAVRLAHRSVQLADALEEADRRRLEVELEYGRAVSASFVYAGVMQTLWSDGSIRDRIAADLSRRSERLDRSSLAIEPHAEVSTREAIGRLARSIGSHELALTQFERIANLTRGVAHEQRAYLQALSMIGGVHHERGDHDRAIPILTEALTAQAGSDLQEDDIRLCESFLATGRRDEAILAARRGPLPPPPFDAMLRARLDDLMARYAVNLFPIVDE